MTAVANRGPNAWLVALGLVGYPVILVAGLVLYGSLTDVDSGFLVDRTLAGSSDLASDAVVDALKWPDIVLIAAYVVALAGLCWLGRWCFQGEFTRGIAKAGATAAFLAGAFDAVENLLLLSAIDQSSDDYLWRLAAAAATVKVVLFSVAAAVSVATVLVLIARLVSPRPDFSWTRAAVLPPSEAVPTGRPSEAEFGVSLSGGGIRSGITTLGVLQVLREQRWLQRADYLVSVSGGGYVSGALRLAAQPSASHIVMSTFDNAFEQKSPELGHLRRHGRYVADGAKEWVVALVVVLRGLLASLGLLAGAVTALGLVIGLGYEAVPLADIGAVVNDDPDLSAAIQPGGLFIVVTTLATAVVLWFVNLLRRVMIDSPSRRVARAASMLGWFGGWLALVCLGVPLLVWSYQVLAAENNVTGAAGTGLTTVLTTYVGALTAILWRRRTNVQSAWERLRSAGQQTGLQSQVSGGMVQRLVVLVVLLVLGLMLFALLAAVISETNTGRAVELLPHGWELFPPALVVLAVLSAGLAFAWRARPGSWQTAAFFGASAAWVVLLVLACVFTSACSELLTRWSGGSDAAWWPQWWCLVAPAVFLAMATLVDQTWMSLHPFYRRRLASAFSVRRVQDPTTGVTKAMPYGFDTETTPLHEYADRLPDEAGNPRVPHLIFAAAANMSGQEETPPGRKATPFTFSYDWVGGPQVGYVRAKDLHERASGAVRADVTVQSAVAVSGAAFASAMGRQARAVQTLLALSNARLGTWLPNPRWLAASHSDGWHQARMPSLRRVTYLLREVVGAFSADDRLLYLTDGGHYENLGLVELLRHRVRTVVCVDAGGDRPPATSDIAEAITLAREELGIRVELDEPWRLTPGRVSAAPPPGPKPPGDLAPRLSEACMVTGAVTYPAVPKRNLEEMKGRIVVVKLRLTADMAYDLLSYAQSHAEFPYDSTSDQWFDERQFNAYHQLGRHLGTKAAAELGLAPRN